MTITLTDVVTIIRKIIDISIVWFLCYTLLKNIKNNVKLSLIFKGVFILIILKVVAQWLGFTTVNLLLDYIIMYGPLALIVIFQPEIRTILEELGRSQFLGRHKTLTFDERQKMIYQIVTAMEYLARTELVH